MAGELAQQLCCLVRIDRLATFHPLAIEVERYGAYEVHDKTRLRAVVEFP